MTGQPHYLPIRIYYEDTDAHGIVYHGNYVRFAERARTEYLRSLGYDQSKLKKEKGIIFVVVAMEIRYAAPARLDDLLSVKTSVLKMGRSSMEMQQDICHADKLITELKVTLVCIDQSFKAVRLPEEIRAAFSK